MRGQVANVVEAGKICGDGCYAKRLSDGPRFFR
jgi:hypothetical protein